MSVNATQRNAGELAMPTRAARPSSDPFRRILVDMPLWTHPELLYWLPEYRLIRDAIEGEATVKAAKDLYLPAFDGMEDNDYALYLQGATFYNFTGRTQNALVGAIFRRSTTIEGVSEARLTELENVTRQNNSFRVLSRFIAQEMLAVDRVAALVDFPAGNTLAKPYIQTYMAENIMDWETGFDEQGRERLTRVVLREYRLLSAAEHVAAQKSAGSASLRRYVVEYRELRLEQVEGAPKGWGYVQQRWINAKGDATYSSVDDATEIVVVRRRGAVLDYIPFYIFGRNGKEARPGTPPLQDIARLNISHYRSYAQLEHGRYFTGFPIYNVEVSQGNTGDYQVGPNRVWETQMGSKVRLLEFNGGGLKSLETALDTKEAQAASLGGRMIGVKATAVSESDNQLRLKERNEQALLLDVASAMDEGCTQLLRWYLWMAGETTETANKAKVEFNKDFLFDGAGAREFRAIHAMYKEGIIPVSVLYAYMRKYEVIPDWMTEAEFTKRLKSLKEFPMQPDAAARSRGFPDRKTELGIDQQELDREHEGDQAELDREAAQEAADAAAEVAKEAADKASKDEQARVTREGDVAGTRQVTRPTGNGGA